jgi:hypothetical protein
MNRLERIRQWREEVFAFVVRREPYNPEETYVEVNDYYYVDRLGKVVRAPDPIRYGDTPSRPATVPVVHFFHPAFPYEVPFRERRAVSRPMITGPHGALRSQGQRTNITRPNPVPYGNGATVRG